MLLTHFKFEIKSRHKKIIILKILYILAIWNIEFIQAAYLFCKNISLFHSKELLRKSTLDPRRSDKSKVIAAESRNANQL